MPAGAVRIGPLPFVCFPAGGAGLFIADGPPQDGAPPVPSRPISRGQVFGPTGIWVAE